MSRFEQLRLAQDQAELTRYYDLLFGWGQPVDESDLCFVAYMLAVRHEAIGEPRTDTQWEFASFLEMRLTHRPITLDMVLDLEDRRFLVRDFINDTLPLLTTSDQRTRLHSLVGTYPDRDHAKAVLDAFHELRNTLDRTELAARFDQMFDAGQPRDDSDLTLIAVLLAAVHEAVGEPRTDTPWPSPKFIDQSHEGGESPLDIVLAVEEPEQTRRQRIAGAMIDDVRPRMNVEQRQRLDKLFSSPRRLG